jgi:hypothetical protein
VISCDLSILIARNFRESYSTNITNMSTRMICLNAVVRVAAVNRCIASHVSARSCKQSFSSLTPYVLSYSSRTTSSRRSSLLLRCEVRDYPSTCRSSIAARRTYATDNDTSASTIQGTIGKGASGVAEEAERVRERLQAPDHLDEKERIIFEKLDGALEPVKLEVCHRSWLGCSGLFVLTRTLEYRFKTSPADVAPCMGLIS